MSGEYDGESPFRPRLGLTPGLELTIEQQLELALEQIETLTEQNRILGDTLEEEKKERKKLEGENRDLQGKVEAAGIDQLTGAYTRNQLEEFAQQLNPARPKEKRDRRRDENGNRRCVLLLDIDNFKQINTKYGHPRGDQVLRQLVPALQMKVQLRKKDRVFRYGGEEIMVVFEGSTASEMMRRFRAEADGAQHDARSVEHTRFGFTARLVFPPTRTGEREEDMALRVTLSGAITDFVPGERLMVETLERLAKGLAEAKEEGRDRIKKITAPDKPLLVDTDPTRWLTGTLPTDVERT